VERFALATGRLRVGNPLDEDADMGPMISEAAARRIESWVDEAIGQGARVLTGHRRDGALYAPTVLLDVPRTARVWRDEVFAPVVSIVPFSDLDEAVALANESESSLQAGVFSRDLDTALTLAEALEAGGVMINDSSDYRFDGMPFGGAKYGSLGREGVRFTVHEMSQPKVFCFRRQPAIRS
jgi:acyl-CoA reductase-like NAD-dependent aldehyde dehydrogenase